MTQTESLDETLHTIAAVACAAVNGCDSTGITLAGTGPPRTVASHGPHALRLDQAQYDDDDGPCLSAYRTNTTVVVDVVPDRAGQWPAFVTEAEQLGVRSVLSMPLGVDRKPFGAMNLYASSVGVFTDEVQEYAHVFAGEAALAIHNASEFWRTRTLVQNLERALESRDLIGQAKGILMAQLRITSAQAFELMREASQHQNVKVRDIAEQIARTGELPEAGGS